jgi:glycosyltransferase involved in cell wall biosynthesis
LNSGSPGLLTVVTVCLNAREFLSECIESVRSQDLDAALFEHVIVDGGSTDGTLELLRVSEGLNWISEEDRGISDAFNKGVSIAQGEWILFLNADDRLASRDVLTRAAELLGQVPDGTKLAYGEVMLTDDSGSKTIAHLGRAGSHRYLFWRMTLPHQGIFFRKSYFEDHGVFDIGLRVAMDYELVLRSRSERFLHIPLEIAHMRSGGRSSQESRQGIRERRLAQLRHGVGPSFWPYIASAAFIVRTAILPGIKFFTRVRDRK